MENETVLCLATRRWHSLWRNTQQIMSRLARNNRVVFVEPQRDPDLSAAASARRQLPAFRSLTVEQVMPNLSVVRTPPGLPYGRQNLPRAWLHHSVPLVSGINNALMRWHLARVRRQLAIVNPILWLYEPRQAGLIGSAGEKLVVYFNYDELADFAPNHRVRDLLQAYDDVLCRRADVVFASSQAQYQRRVRLNPNTHFVPNGVDHELFSQALSPTLAEPTELADLPRPILGFVGWLGHQLDVPLLARLAAAYPAYSLVLVGPDALKQDTAYRELRTLPNVTFAGRQPLKALPAFLKAFDVALLPYNLAGHTYAIYPLKLHEYLAAGRSVVATALPELQPFAGDIRIAPDHQRFIELVPEALAANSAEARARRTALAQAHTWDQRVATVHQALDARLATRGQRPAARSEALTPIQAGQ
jgi:glycosyltransferase involved in cell wall biosynthesis